MRVLVVDDSATMRRILGMLLADLQVRQVDEAVNGREAVEETAATAYDLVLLDWNMPEMLGIDALIAIRARGDQVPIIMVTTEAEKRRVLDALKAGANNYVIKPFVKDALLTKIRQTVPGLLPG